MHHPAADNLHPVLALTDADLVARALIAHVHLRARLGEGEVVGAEAYLHVAFEIGADELHQAPLEVAHIGGLVDHQPFGLVEHGRMRLVGVAAIGPALRDNADRRLLVQHRADLHGGRMGAQDQRIAVLVRLFQEEGIVRFARRMIGREIQRREIVEIVLDIRAFADHETHFGEDHRDLFHHLADRVNAALRTRADRQGDIRALGRQTLVQMRFLKRLTAGRDGVFQPLAQRVQRLSGLFALFRVHLAQFAHHQGNAALLAERGNPRIVERAKILRGVYLAAQIAFKLVQIVHDPSPVFSADEASLQGLRRGRGTSSPPQLGQTLPCFCSAQSAQNVHS